MLFGLTLSQDTDLLFKADNNVHIDCIYITAQNENNLTDEGSYFDNLFLKISLLEALKYLKNDGAATIRESLISNTVKLHVVGQWKQKINELLNIFHHMIEFL